MTSPALERALTKIGFEVISVKDAGYGDLNRAVNGYIRRLNAAGPGAVGFFYYSGHGAQNSDNGTNYVIPVDVKTVDAELWDASVPLKSVTDALKDRAPNATHFVVFDACRNTLRLVEPGSKALVQAKGFEPVRVLPGMLIAFATAEGEVASDIGDGIGPYARFLAEEIVKPDVEAVTMFRSVQLRVRDTIRQEPWLSYGALSPVWFAGRNDARPPISPPPTTTPGRLSEAAEAWDRVKDTNSIALLEAFNTRFKDTFYADMARARAEELKKQQVAIASPALTSSAPNPGSTGVWSELGCQQISLLTDRDNVRVPRRSERFRAVRLHARDKDLEVLEVRLIYTNTHEENFPIRQVIRSGQRTRPLEFGRELPVESVNMIYRSVSSERGSASVCVEGLR